MNGTSKAPANGEKVKIKRVWVLSIIFVIALVGILSALLGQNSPRGIYYSCKTFECSFTLPESWKGKYGIDEPNNKIAYVYHKKIREKYGQGTGLLFYIEILEGEHYTFEDITDPGNRSIALKEGGYTYVFGMPTDVQYPIWEGGDKKLADDYVKMTGDFEMIKESIKRPAD